MINLDRARHQLDLAQVVAYLGAGISWTATAAAFGVSRSTLQRHVVAAGVDAPRVPRGRRPVGGAYLREALVRLRTRCWTNVAIARALNVSAATVSRLAAALDVPPVDPLMRRVGTATVGVVCSMVRAGDSNSEVARQLGIR